MLGTMASLGAGRDSASALPLALALIPREAHSHHRQNPYFHHHHLLAHPFSYDPIRRLALARLPPPRRPATTNKPFTSFCIRDILGGDVDREDSSRLSETSSSSPSNPLTPRSGNGNENNSSRGGNSKTHTSYLSRSATHGVRSGSREGTGVEWKSREGASASKTLISHNVSKSTPSTTLTNRTLGSNGEHGRSRPSVVSPPPQPCTLSSLNSTSLKVQVPAVSLNGVRIVRPWAPSPSSPDTELSSDDGIDSYHEHMNDNEDDDDNEEEISVDDDEPMPRQRKGGNKSGVSPLDALMAMTSKTFEGLEAPDAADARRRDQAALFGKHAPPKKRRKSRTAFTNQQIYELEKRFLYQKYLTPADRDEIAHSLGLSNAQVITWFQNRRAKLKRDLEELKNDVTAARKHPVHKTLMGTVAEMQLRKVHEEVLQKAAAAAAAGVEPVANSSRREESREDGNGGVDFTPPSSPCSMSATVTSPPHTLQPKTLHTGTSSSVTSPAAVRSPSMMSPASPAGSYRSNRSNSSDENLSPGSVCSLSASNNNTRTSPANNNTNTTTNNNTKTKTSVSNSDNSDSSPPGNSQRDGLRVASKDFVTVKRKKGMPPTDSPAVSSPPPCEEQGELSELHEGDQEEEMEVDVSEEQDSQSLGPVRNT